jgi:hypothetical protein
MAFVLPVLFVENGGSLIRCPIRKFQRGFEAFERNTGNSHPLASKLEHSDKRGASISVTVPLNHRSSMWTGTIAVGTPASGFTGQSLFRVSAAVEADHIMCSPLRHGERRFVPPWDEVHEHRLQTRPYLLSLPELHREGPDAVVFLVVLFRQRTG